MEIKVYYEDTDCGGVVYYANYFKYFERARTEYLETHGLSVSSLHRQGLVFVVTEANACYKSPARYGEVLVIDTTISAPRKSLLKFTHTIRERHTQRLIVEGAASLVMTDGKGKVKRVSSDLLHALHVGQGPPAAL